MTAFEVMGEHWFVTLALGFLAAGCVHRACNLGSERIKERARQRALDREAAKDHELRQLLSQSMDRYHTLTTIAGDGAMRAHEAAYQWRLELELGLREDPMPPQVAEMAPPTEEQRILFGHRRTLHGILSADHFPAILQEDSAPITPRRSRSRRPSDETSVDTAAVRDAGSSSESLEAPNDPSNTPRNRRRNIRLPS